MDIIRTDKTNGSLRIADANGDKGVEFDGTVVSTIPANPGKSDFQFTQCAMPGVKMVTVLVRLRW